MRQAWLPILNEPIKQTNNSEKQKREIGLVWPYWEEQRSKDIPFLQSVFGIFTWELGLNTRQGVHKSSPSKVCFFLSLSELCKIFFQEASSLTGTKFQPFFFSCNMRFLGKFQFLGEHCFQWCDNQREGHECLFSIYTFLNWGFDSVVQGLPCKQEAWSLNPQNPYKC